MNLCMKKRYMKLEIDKIVDQDNYSDYYISDYYMLDNLKQYTPHHIPNYLKKLGLKDYEINYLFYLKNKEIKRQHWIYKNNKF